MKPIFKAVPEPVDSTSKELAAALGLPWENRGMPKLIIGRREWIALPELGVSALHAKIDTGARGSSIHAENVEISADKKSVRFLTANYLNELIACETAIVKMGRVRSSSGISRKRIFIETTANLPGGFCWKILLSLANRGEMLCPMLLGRRAMTGYFLIDPQSIHLLGPRKLLEQFTVIIEDRS